MDDRTGRPEQIMAPALRSIIKTIDLAIENGSTMIRLGSSIFGTRNYTN